MSAGSCGLHEGQNGHHYGKFSWCRWCTRLPRCTKNRTWYGVTQYKSPQRLKESRGRSFGRHPMLDWFVQWFSGLPGTRRMGRKNGKRRAQLREKSYENWWGTYIDGYTSSTVSAYELAEEKHHRIKLANISRSSIIPLLGALVERSYRSLQSSGSRFDSGRCLHTDIIPIY